MITLRGTNHDPARQDGFRAAAAATLTLLAMAIFALAADPVGIVALLPAAALAVVEAVRGFRRWRGRRSVGDQLVANLLRDLNDDYYLVENVTPGRKNRRGQVLIGPCGVLVIETRRTTGRVLCYSERWYVNGWRRRGFGRRIRRAASTIDRNLRRWCPEDASSYRRVEALVVFTHPRCRLNVYRPRTLATRYSELLQLVWSLERRNNLSSELACRLAERLAHGPAEAASEPSLKHAEGW
ncbi:MAG TPA: nuclease-related domain-containing protein [Methylomirabilota bacterium]|nr:nuclease-related domain-containing protein [Methylomirabilota bacterium]